MGGRVPCSWYVPRTPTSQRTWSRLRHPILCHPISVGGPLRRPISAWVDHRPLRRRLARCWHPLQMGFGRHFPTR
eukprot:6183527-Pleurochrysis_carterae.AAC.2